MSKLKLKRPAANQAKTIKDPLSKVPTPDIDYPVFCFRYLVKGYDLDECTKDELAALVKRLGMLSKLSWEQVRLAPRHGLGTEKIARTAIKAPVPGWATADVDYFLALRFLGNAPFVGHKQGAVFHILWIDRVFTLYNHG